MPSVLYSTNCAIKEDLYRLRIYVDDPAEEPVASPFTSVDIPLRLIEPSLTRLDFQFIEEKKKSSTSIPQTIRLHHLLNVKHLSSTKKISQLETSVRTTPTIEQSIDSTELSFTPSGNHIALKRQQFSLGRFFSRTSSSTVISKSLIRLDYVDVSAYTRWNIKTIQLEVDCEEVAEELYKNLTLCLSTLTQRPRRLLAFVNPLSGKGQARLVFEKKVLPIFQEANVSVETILTERASHAEQFILNENLTDYDGLVCVGGDGMFAELCHGLLLRTLRDAEKDINKRDTDLIRPNLRIGIIPAGSTDAVVFGTTGLNDPVTSALQIIVGESLSIDITTVHNENGFVRFMATMLAYGFFGDIIQQSDRWRCLGPLRYDLAGFLQFIRNTSYHSELTITLSADEPKAAVDAPAITSLVSPDLQNLLSSESSLGTPVSPFCSRNCGKCADGETIRSPMQIKREGRYTTVNCLNMPCRCAKSKYGMSPFVHLGDGTFDLILVKRSWRTGFLRFLWQVANDSRTIEDLPNVERFRVSEVLIRPVPARGKRAGHWACDGELVHGNEIQVRVHRQALNLFASGIDFQPLKNKTTNNCFQCIRDDKNPSNGNE